MQFVQASRWGQGVSVVALALLSVYYCWPHHISVGHSPALDALFHAALFAAIGLWFEWITGCGVRVAVALATLGALLEVVQWRIGGYPRIEIADILANEAGVALAFVPLWLKGRLLAARQ